MNAREIAYKSLKNIIKEHGFSNLVLRKNLNELKSIDKGFITQIVYGTLRNYLFLTYQFEDFVHKKLPIDVEILLAMSAYQLFMMDKVPDYALVNESINIASKDYKGVVNAILRRLTERGLKEVDKKDELEALAIKTSLPLWIVKMWNSHYGKETTVKICYGLLEQSVVYGRLNTILLTKKQLEKDDNVHFIDEQGFIYDKDLISSDYFKNGEVIIQDISSQQVCKYLDLKQGLKVLDCCGAPGTKTSQIAMLMNNTGSIVSVDLYEHRVELINQLAAKMKITNISARVCDASKVDLEFEADYFDRVLADVPCSGLGVLKGKPDIKYRILPSDIDSIVSIQKEILKSSSKCLKVNGILVYSTCTLNKKENDKQVENFLLENPNFSLVESKTLFPFDNNGDGFFVAKLVRNS